MMPGLDGFELLRALRADRATRMVAVVTGVCTRRRRGTRRGLDAGADDYMVKPFAARELVARVQAQIVRSKMRSLEEAHAVRLTSIFEHTPVGVAILRGPTHVFEFANREYSAWWPTGLSSANRCEKRCQKSRDRGCSNCWTGSTNPDSLMSVAPLS